MKIPRGLVGQSLGPLTHEIDARWMMAYAAGLGETDPAYLDTLRGDGIVAHPMFPVCYEWPLAVESRGRQLGADVALRGVHATHDLTLHRRLRAGDRLTTTAAVVAVAPRRAGAYVLTRYETRDARGEPVSTTDYGSVYLGVSCEPEGTLPSPPRERERGKREAEIEWTDEVPIPATLAHVYSECARIWNPIHTDPEVARRAGLPRIILHGTATLALAVSAALRREDAGAAARVTRISGRFTGMVPLPSGITVRGGPAQPDGAGRLRSFRATGADGAAVLSEGRLCLA